LPEQSAAASSTFRITPTTTTEIYTLSLHDALPISVVRFGRAGRAIDGRHLGARREGQAHRAAGQRARELRDEEARGVGIVLGVRSEEHTSELQSPYDLVCRLLLEKKKNNRTSPHTS